MGVGGWQPQGQMQTALGSRAEQVLQSRYVMFMAWCTGELKTLRKPAGDFSVGARQIEGS